MMPKMEGGRCDEPFQRAKPPAHVRVDEKAPKRHEQHQHGRDHCSLDALRRAEAENVDRDQPAYPNKSVINGVCACADQEVDVLRVMVDRMKPPKQRDLMRPTMTPIEAEIGHDEG